jgi:DNA replication initiation complex subunit (GINS family)
MKREKLINEFYQILRARMWDLNNKIGHDVTKRCHQTREYADDLKALDDLASLLESPVRRQIHRQVKIPVRNALLYGE